MDAAAFATKVRALPSGTGLPLLVLTGIGARAPGAALFGTSLTKPVRSRDLRAALAEVLSAAPAPPTRGAAGLGRVGSASMLSERPLRVLLVEDNVTNQLVTELMLAKLGHFADIVANGREAVERTSRVSYDVVLMDVYMPFMDGLEATRRIRAELAVQPTIIAMTASSLDEDRRSCAAAGMDGYLLKPVRLDHLAAALDDASEGGGAWRAPPSSGQRLHFV
jgi:CheY-like chemotaxis protein